jgi:anthranilate phosphoribosyltransferase
MAEALGVDVECCADMVAQSIKKTGIGLFNGMSPQIHPKALGRILSNISFGSTLNIAASLANPALPKRGVRGVYAREMVMPVAKVMQAIGYERALVVYGGIDGSEKGMDEASVCGTTYCAELCEDKSIREFTFRPADFGWDCFQANDLCPAKDIDSEAKRFVSLLRGKQNGARSAAAAINAGLIFYVAGKADQLGKGVEKAAAVLHKGTAFGALENWVAAQNREPQKGLEKLKCLTE